MPIWPTSRTARTTSSALIFCAIIWCIVLEERVQRGHHFAIIDEVDSILIDEARTPLIIAAPDAAIERLLQSVRADRPHCLKKDKDYEVDEKRKSVSILDAGVEKVEKVIALQNIYAPENIRLVHYLEESVKAKALFLRDRDYVVKNGEVIIVDEFTGRMLIGRRYQAGLHQAIEAKEGVIVKEESPHVCEDFHPELFPHVRENFRYDGDRADLRRGVL